MLQCSFQCSKECLVILTLIGTFQLRTIKSENNKNISLRLRLGKIIFLVLFLKHGVVKAEIEIYKQTNRQGCPCEENQKYKSLCIIVADPKQILTG